jgi:hypothetical protein
MRRGLARGLGALGQQQVQEVVPKQQKQRYSLVERLLGSPRPAEQPPLNEPLGVELPEYSPPSEPPTASVTRLQNGAHVAAEESEVQRLHCKLLGTPH